MCSLGSILLSTLPEADGTHYRCQLSVLKRQRLPGFLELPELSRHPVELV